MKEEKYLINLGVTANPKLINQHYTNPERRGIRGLIRGGQGKVAKATVISVKCWVLLLDRRALLFITRIRAAASSYHLTGTSGGRNPKG
jgi:hypothetical protein